MQHGGFSPKLMLDSNPAKHHLAIAVVQLSDRFEIAHRAWLKLIHSHYFMYGITYWNVQVRLWKLPLGVGIAGGFSLRWRHNGQDGVSNQQPHDCLLNRLFRRISKKISNLCVTGLCGWLFLLYFQCECKCGLAAFCSETDTRPLLFSWLKRISNS